MDIVALLVAYIATVQANVTTKVAINSITPIDVGNIGEDLAQILIDYFGYIPQISTGTAAPTGGGDGDIYFQAVANGFNVWRKEGGSWVDKGNVPVGLPLVDGIRTGLRAFIDGLDVTVTPGSWVISNVQYDKLTETGLTVPAADLNFLRYDLIYADDTGTIGYTEGVASSSPSFPTPATGQIAIDYVVVPSSASGADPYLLSGGQSGGISSNAVFVSGTSDSGGEFDVTSYNVGEWPNVTIYDVNGLSSPAQYDNTNKKIVYLNPSEAFTAKFSNGG